MTKTRLKQMLMPFWESRIIYEETFLPVRDRDGSFSPVRLLYPVSEIVSVKQYANGKKYCQGKDFTVENGNLLLESVNFTGGMNYEELYLSAPGKLRVSSIREEGKFLRIEDGNFFNDRYIGVTYKTDSALIPSPKIDKQKLISVYSRLRARENIKVVFYGDSITTGVNATGYFNKPPYFPVFSQVVVQTLREHYSYCGQSDIAHINTAVGGWTSVDGLKNLQEGVLRHDPQIVVLAFGMNDGGGFPSTDFQERFYSRMKEMTEKIHISCPDCFVILVSPILPNVDAFNYDDGYPVLSNQSQCRASLQKIADEKEYVALADVGGIYDYFAERKRFCDMGDNMVHPNDFVCRLYAQVLLNLLLD